MSKKILFSLMAILLAVGLVGAGAFAYFSDVETSEDNVLSAGTLYLDSYTSDGTVNGSQRAIFTVSDVAPGSKGYGWVAFYTRGSISPGEVDVAISTIINDDNGLNDPEKEAGDTTGGSGQGELGANMEMAVIVGGGSIRDDVFEPPGEQCLYMDGSKGNSLVYYKANDLGGAYWNDVLGHLNSGSWRAVNIMWRIPETVDNVIQSDSITFDVTLTYEQPEAD